MQVSARERTRLIVRAQDVWMAELKKYDLSLEDVASPTKQLKLIFVWDTNRKMEGTNEKIPGSAILYARKVCFDGWGEIRIFTGEEEYLVPVLDSRKAWEGTWRWVTRVESQTGYLATL